MCREAQEKTTEGVFFRPSLNEAASWLAATTKYIFWDSSPVVIMATGDIPWNPITTIRDNQRQLSGVDYVEGALTVGSVVAEPLDWAMIAHDASQNGLEVEHAMALLPLLSHGTIRALDEGAEAFEQMSRRGEDLVDGMRVSEDEVLDMAEDFLGPNYREFTNGRFVSEDGLRQVRMGETDLNGSHAGGPHLNFDNLIVNPRKPDRLMPDPNDSYHIYFGD